MSSPILSRLLSRLFSRNDPPSGIELDTSVPFFAVWGETDFSALLMALVDLLPEGCVLYFEDGFPRGDLRKYLEDHRIPARANVARGSYRSKTMIFHVPATPQTMTRLAELSQSCAYPELAIHFHVYREQSVLLEWHDVFSPPMSLSGTFPEQKVSAFAERLGMIYGVCDESGA